ncbi:MAG: ABC transporter ATP-binding protein [Anaerolineales bacterium]|jgi:ABC-2 type transport system ATP-binding protein
MNEKTAAITARQLTKRFGDFTAVDSIDFDVYSGEIFGFLGPNGSGKTTTIRMALGLLQPSSGTVTVLGIPVSKVPQQIRPRVGYMSQRFSLYNDLTVLQNLRFYGMAYGLSNSQLQERIQEALALAGLKGRQATKTRDLSGGWRQRLALSAAILHKPELLFLDEPTAGVDPVSRRLFWDLLYRLTAEGVTIFITTHYMDEAEHCQRLAFIQRGRIIAYGSPGEIKKETMHGPVLEIASSDAAQAIKALRAAQAAGRLPAEKVELYGSLVHVVAPGIEKNQNNIRKILKEAGVQLEQISTIEPSLEDVFIASMNDE